MYSIVLVMHSWVRWAVLLAGLVAFFRSLTRRQQPWTPADNRASSLFIVFLDIQLLLGVLLYFVWSPITQLAFDDFGGAMRTSGIRFWAVEHVFGALLGLALAHIGRTRIRRATSDARRHKLALIFYGLALLAILAAIPWPGSPNARPLFRF